MLTTLVCCLTTIAPAKWTPIFNGKNLDGWSPKITGYSFGENFGKTFRVKDGAIVVDYSAYNGEFKGRFGHLFYKTPFSKYRMRFKYRFTGEQIKDGPGWAWRNSGLMVHCQDPKTMTLTQEFPVSAEIQLLGGVTDGERTTGNLCTPGTNVVINGKLVTQHCTNSNSETFPGDGWVRLEVEVNGSSTVKHFINSKLVMEYEQVQFDPIDADTKRLGGAGLIDQGYVSLQSESHPVEFKEIEILKL